jgi:anti-anti-sigma factor
MSDLGAELDVTPTPTGWQLRGELDAHTAPSLAKAMEVLPPGEIIVDMAGVSFVDSSGLRVLLDATNRARNDGGDLTLSGPQASIRRLIEISGLNDFMHVRG